LADYDDASILAELKRLAEISGSGTMMKADIVARGRMSYELVWKRFGSLRQALRMAQLTPTRFMTALCSSLRTPRTRRSAKNRLKPGLPTSRDRESWNKIRPKQTRGISAGGRA
jgi:hypothetical protein